MQASQQTMPVIKLDVTLAQAQTIVNHLARGVFLEVEGLIEQIKSQAESQLQATQAPAKDPAPVAATVAED